MEFNRLKNFASVLATSLFVSLTDKTTWTPVEQPRWNMLNSLLMHAQETQVPFQNHAGRAFRLIWLFTGTGYNTPKVMYGFLPRPQFLFRELSNNHGSHTWELHPIRSKNAEREHSSWCYQLIGINFAGSKSEDFTFRAPLNSRNLNSKRGYACSRLSAWRC